MSEKPARPDARVVEDAILTVRGQRVILDRALAAVYGVPTFRFNEAVKRNRARFPPDFAFQLEPQEVANLISQNAISSSSHGGVRKLPWAFTEHGAVMAANILRSDRAIQMSVFVVRAFMAMRVALTDTRALAQKLATLEREVKARLDTHDAAIVDVLQRIMDIIDPPASPEPPRKQIGYAVREQRSAYAVQRKRTHL